jgi:predicted dienelactone hydrolase
MRSLEISVLIAELLAVCAVFAVSDRPHIIRLIFVAPAVLSIPTIVREGYRWQMLGAYLAAALLLMLAISRSSWLSATWAFVTGALALSAMALAWVFPVFQLPAPTGPECIGTTVAALTDHSRVETAEGARPGPREVVVQTWYPAQCQPDAPRARYQPKEIVSRMMSQVALVRTHSVLSAPLNAGGERFPLVIFSPSWGGDRRQDTFLFEELASHGYVVVSLDHPYGSGVTLFPDGRIVRGTGNDWLDYSSKAAYQRSHQRIARELETRVADVQFVLTQIENHNRVLSPVVERIDVARSGVMGHSFGGTVAAEVCRRDERCKGAINMDGLMMGQSAEAGVPRPFFIMSDETVLPSATAISKMDKPQQLYYRSLFDDVDHIEHTLSEYGGYSFSLRGGHHMNFSDTPLYSKLRRYTGGGPIAPDRAFTIIRAYALAFFNQCLKGMTEPLLNGPSPSYPETADFRKYVPALNPSSRL